MSDPFRSNLQNIITLKPWKLDSWHFERMFTPHHVPGVTYHLLPVTCHLSFVTCHMSYYNFFFKLGDLVGEEFVFNEAYPVNFWRFWHVFTYFGICVYSQVYMCGISKCLDPANSGNLRAAKGLYFCLIGLYRSCHISFLSILIYFVRQKTYHIKHVREL